MYITKKNKKIDIPDDLVNLYEDNVETLDEKTAKYLIKTSGHSINDSDEDIRSALIFGIKDELSAFLDIDKLLKK